MKIQQMLYILSLIFFSYLYSYPFFDMDRSIMTIFISYVIFIILFFILRKEDVSNLDGQMVKHSSIFLLGFIIVHFQFYLDFVLGFLSKSDFRIWIEHKVVLKSFILSICGLLSFLIGYEIVKTNKLAKHIEDIKENFSTSFLSYFSLIFLLAFYATVDPRYLLGFYGQVELSPEANYAQFGFQVVTFAVLIQNVRNAFGKENTNTITFKKYIFSTQGSFISSIILIYLLSVLLSGDRGPLISMSLCYLAGYLFLTKFKFKKPIFFGGILLGAFLVTMLGQVRLMDKNISFVERLIMAISGEGVVSPVIGESRSILPQTKELATSVRTLHLATSYVPENHNFMYGRFQVQQILGIIPFGTEFKNLLFDDLSYQYTGSGQFVTWVEQGDRRFYGLGTTCIADFYLDFGLFGVIFGMFFFGIMIRKSELAIYENRLPSISLHVFSFVYLAFSLYISRSTVLFNLKLCAFIIIVMILNKYIINRKNR